LDWVKIVVLARCLFLIPVIPAIQKAGRSRFEANWVNSLQDLIAKNTSQKEGWWSEWLKV
jgi:hypothetical protein